jgi:exopolysaccharide production protein ExoZ
LGVGWTLNYEVFFYLAFGCTLALPNRATRFKVLAIALGAMVCLRPLAAADSAIAIRDTSPLFMEFLMGMAIGAQLPRIQRRSSALGGALITIAIALLIGAWLQWPQMPKTIATGIPAALLVAGALMLEDMIRRQRWLKPLQALGDASYSMYLVHGLILALIEWYAPAPLKSAIALPAWIAVMLAASFASHRWVETPLLNAMRTWTNSHPRQATP